MLFARWLPTLLDWPLSILLIILFLVVILIYVYQERLIYMPTFPPGSRTVVWTPDRFGMRFERVTVTAPDGVKTENYYIPWQHSDSHSHHRHQLDTKRSNDKEKSRKAIIFCHANAGNLGHRLPIIKRIRDLLSNHGEDVAVFMPSYRGYGESEGSPDEAGIRLDVQAGLDWFVDRLDAAADEPYELYAYGQSIGGAVAIDLVSRNEDRFAGLIVENTFTSLPDLIPHVMPVLRFMAPLCRQRWASRERLGLFKRGRVRVLILSGLQDQLIPPHHSQSLHDHVKARPQSFQGVRLIKFPKGNHNDTVLQSGYFEAIIDFILQIQQHKK